MSTIRTIIRGELLVPTSRYLSRPPFLRCANIGLASYSSEMSLVRYPGFVRHFSEGCRRDAKEPPKPSAGQPEISKQVPLPLKDAAAVPKDVQAKPSIDDTAIPVTKPPKKLSLWEKIVKEAKHYWDGTKLLGYEIKVSSKLVLKLAAGRELSRREDRQLKRTLQDIIRIVPFSLFIIIPFAELLLPVALKLFPNLLPSTYESQSTIQSKVRKLSDTRKSVSEYLKHSAGVAMPRIRNAEQQKQFDDFFKLVRLGEKPSKELTLAVARLFKDDLLLDNLSHGQLAAMAKYMNLHPYGTSSVVRYSIRHRMRQIKQDDRVIDKEGVQSLNTLELQNACQARGFKVYGVSPGRLSQDLSNWLMLRREHVPCTLLILSSVYTYGVPDMDNIYDNLFSVLSTLPPEVYHETELEMSSDKATNEQRLEVLKEQQELIQDENKEEVDSGHIIQVRDNLNVDDPQDLENHVAESTKPSIDSTGVEHQASKQDPKDPRMGALDVGKHQQAEKNDGTATPKQ